MVADEVVETPYAVCKTAVLTVELIGNNKYANHYSARRKTRHLSYVPDMMDIKINFAVCVVKNNKIQVAKPLCTLLYQIELSPAIAGEWDLNP